MFQTVCVRTQRPFNGTHPLDLGSIAEAMVYYGTVRVVGGQGELRQLIDECSIDVFFALLDGGFLKFSYLNGGTSIQTENAGNDRAVHRAIFYSLPSWNLHDVCVKLAQDITGKSGRGRRIGLRLANMIHEVQVGAEVREEFMRDYSAPQLLAGAARALLPLAAPTSVFHRDGRHAGREMP